MKPSSPRCFRFPSALRTSLGLIGLLLAGLSLSAQPSGGPYGPIQQRYEVPKAKTVYYVAPDGQAARPGTALDQPTTLDAAIERVVTGDAIVLRGGTYRTGGLKLNQGITLQPYADERPIIKGTQVATEWKAQPNGLWRTSWKKLFPAKPADWWRRERHAKETPLHLFNNDMVFLDGELLHAVGEEADVQADSYYIDYETGDVYLGVDPKDRLVEITAHDSALVRTMADVHGKTNDRKGPTIRGLTFTQYAYRALEVEGIEPEKLADPSTFGKEVVGTTLEHVTISFCSRVAGYFRGDNFVVRNCLISHNGTEGIYVINSGDILLEKNIIRHTNVEKIQGYYASAVKIFNQSYRAVVRDNLIIDNPDSSGVWWDVGNVDGRFLNNWVQNTNDGFFFEISKGAICAGNVFVNCTRGVWVLNSSNVHVYQNTFYNSDAAFTRNERSAVGDHFGWHPSTGPDVHERVGHKFVNNLVAADETFKGPLLRADQTPTVAHLTEPHFSELDGNVFVRRAPAMPQPLVLWSPVKGEKEPKPLRSLEELRKLYPQFAAKSQVYPDYHGVLFRGVELGKLELLAGFAGAKNAVPVPELIPQLLGWKAAPSFPGAYAPVR